mmetsp:Transcript_1454/g.3242  ORF Transcript_1454/g.3242 Transcript_1454/m.3242 type:complete len:203 (-) Transcript_1454:371-979(-)
MCMRVRMRRFSSRAGSLFPDLSLGVSSFFSNADQTRFWLTAIWRMTRTAETKKIMTKKMRKCRISNSWISRWSSPVYQNDKWPSTDSCPAKPVVSTKAMVPMKPRVASSPKNFSTTFCMVAGVLLSMSSFIVSNSTEAVTMAVTKMSAHMRSAFSCPGVSMWCPTCSSSTWLSSCSSSSCSCCCVSCAVGSRLCTAPAMSDI